MRGAADTTLQKDVKETQPLVFQPLTSPFDFLTVENEILKQLIQNTIVYKKQTIVLKSIEKGGIMGVKVNMRRERSEQSQHKTISNT